MDIIDMAVKIIVIFYRMFPKSSLPQKVFAAVIFY